MEQPTIFDESFEDASPIRRRALLSLILKIYIWAGLIIYSLVLLTTLVNSISLLIQYPSTLENSQWMLRVITSLFSASIVILMTASLWLEYKWAIRCNWICGGLYGLFLFISLFAGMMVAGVMIMAVCTIPYWYFLYQIKDQWEHEAVKG